jgi:hypothetical protein
MESMEVSTLTMVLKNSFYKEDMTDRVKRKQSDKQVHGIHALKDGRLAVCSTPEVPNSTK